MEFEARAALAKERQGNLPAVLLLPVTDNQRIIPMCHLPLRQLDTFDSYILP